MSRIDQAKPELRRPRIGNFDSVECPIGIFYKGCASLGRLGDRLSGGDSFLFEVAAEAKAEQKNR